MECDTIFLLKEAGKETCSKTNPYEDEFFKAHREFEEKYGIWGEKLLTPEEQENVKSNRSHRVYFPGDVEEYKELSEKYMGEEQKLGQYRVDCKNEALSLFSKWFYDLWD